MLFDTLAFFSPAVDHSLRVAWVRHGGSLVRDNKRDFPRAAVCFCAGKADPMLERLLSMSLVVRHSAWISKCIAEQFHVPVSKYVLDDQFVQLPSQAPQPTVLKRPLDSTLDISRSDIIDHRPLKKARMAPVQTASPTLIGIQPPSALPSPFTVPKTRSFFPFPPGPTKLSSPALIVNQTVALPAPRIDFTQLRPVQNLRKLTVIRHAPPAAARPKSNVLRTSIRELRAHPRPVACAFVLEEKFQDKVFSGARIASP
ncbi:hypothetical protein C8F01DRAFT_1124839 [Mycena amicta]|nr:hypothetical protein C8F01DRAFT_1124839 [Mycena amicta]